MKRPTFLMVLDVAAMGRFVNVFPVTFGEVALRCKL
jgi:hypothetical protein